MTIVLDSDIIVAQVIELDYSTVATQLLQQWLEQDVELVMPTLALYEIVSVLRKAMVVQQRSQTQINQALQSILELEIRTIDPTPELLISAIDWATKINQTAAYDGAFLAVAESLHTELWTADNRLANATRALGIDWVHYVLQDLTS